MVNILATYDFESATQDAPITASSPWAYVSGGAAIAGSSEAAVHGSMGGRIANATTYTRLDYVDASASTATRVQSFYFTLRAVAANLYLGQVHSDGSGTLTGTDWRVNTARTVTIRNNSVAVGTSGTALQVGTTYRAEWKTTSSTQELRIYEGESDTPLFTPLTGANGAGTRQAIATGSAVAANGCAVDLDTIRIADDWTGPYAAAPADTVSVTGVLSNTGFTAFGTTDLVAALTDSSDTTGIRSGSTGGVIVYSLGTLTDGPVTLTMRHKLAPDGTAGATRKYELMQGSTVIMTSDTYTLPASITEVTVGPTDSGETANITDRSNLRVRITDTPAA